MGQTGRARTSWCDQTNQYCFLPKQSHTDALIKHHTCILSKGDEEDPEDDAGGYVMVTDAEGPVGEQRVSTSAHP